MTGVRLVAIPQNLSLTTLALGGATIGTDTLGVTGTTTLGGNATITGTLTGSVTNGFAIGGGGTTTGIQVALYNTGLGIGSAAPIYWTSGNLNATGDLFIGRQGAASLRLGNVDVDTSPVAQTLRTQGALAGGTSDVAGANWTFIASPGKGTGIGGSLIFQTAPAGSTGTVVNAPATVLTLDSTKLATFAGALSAVGSLTFNTNTAGIVLKRGANGLCGTFVANGATPVVVNNSNIAITDSIIISLNTIGGTVGVQPHVSAITGATSFAVTCTAVDTSTYNYAIIKNAA